MWEKFKNWILGIGGAIIAFLALLLGIKKRKIDKLENENKVKDVVIKEVGIAKEAEKAHSEKLSDIQKESSEEAEEVLSGNKGYNDVIKDWNNH